MPTAISSSGVVEATGDWKYLFCLYDSLSELVANVDGIEATIHSCFALREKRGDWADDDLSCLDDLSEADATDELRSESWTSELLTLQYYIHEAIAEEFWANLALSNLADFLATATGQKVRSLSYGIGADLSPDWIGSVRIAISNLLTLKPDPSGAVESDWLNCVQPKWIQFREQQTDESFRRHSETVKAVMLRISGQAGGHMWEPLSSQIVAEVGLIFWILGWRAWEWEMFRCIFHSSRMDLGRGGVTCSGMCRRWPGSR